MSGGDTRGCAAPHENVPPDVVERSSTRGALGMTHNQEVQVQTRGPDGGNPPPKRQGPKGDQGSGGSHRCATVSSESEAP
jgi:hypothetical protein